MFEGYFKEVSGNYQRGFKIVSRMFQVRLKSISSISKEVSRVFESSLSGKFQLCFKVVSRKFQKCFKNF